MGVLFSKPTDASKDKFRTKVKTMKQSKVNYERKRRGQNAYRMHNNHVYWRGQKIGGGVNSKLFKDLGDGYAKDKKYIYYRGQRIDTYSVNKNFKVLKNGYAKNRDHVFFKGVITTADPKTFKVLGSTQGKDKKRLYVKGRAKRKSSRKSTRR